MSAVNRQIRLAARPTGEIDENTFTVTEEPIPQPSAGEFVVAVDYVSVDPAMRGWLDDVPSYIPPVGIGEVMRAHAVGTVVVSENDRYPVDTVVSGPFGAQEYAVSDGHDIMVVDTDLAPAPTWLGALGFPGMTAYFGLLDVAQTKPGDTVLISGAAGAVGSIAGQIAKLMGCRVIGVAGGERKCSWLTDELGFDAAIDYKQGSIGRPLRAAAPTGIDVYFDNVGGDVLNSALAQLRTHARVAICGAISGYNATTPPPGPSRYLSLLINRASMAGFIIFDYRRRYPEAQAALQAWIRSGQITAAEQVEKGDITAFGDTLAMLFSGANTGKLVLQIR
ncbi:MULTISPECIES: NADP-dependent oxidoreductase [Gordonia]|uniref:NADP-dependent oxidoreductase n=1 Tax=Gordonia TaxID=2053 RepID=UPI0007EAE18B|nr:NADP-dependent oxidoreductase [Gordonia sp. 852002-50395_SCH5434458]OBC07077.1 NADP-dependent oxidoreductase [Gordonia sp. 852002-50395_SCH5434458]